MNRSDFQQLAMMRLGEAEALLAAGHFVGAYYLAGYVVECALKSCIAKGVQQYDFPDKKTVDKSWSHNLAQLAETAALKPTLDAEQQASPAFATNWAVVIKWKESDRYDPSISQVKAQDMVAAVKDPTDGILPWLTQHW
jgi:hypothetical protein